MTNTGLEKEKWNQIWLIPFAHQNQKIGMALLKCHSGKADMATVQTLTEQLGLVLTEAFEHQEAHHACQERVKELRCLYEISRLASLPDTGKNEILKEIALILPESMQFSRNCDSQDNSGSTGFSKPRISGKCYMSFGANNN